VVVNHLVGYQPPTKVLHNSYSMGTCGLLDMSTRCLRAAGSRAEGGLIRQIMSAHVITNVF